MNLNVKFGINPATDQLIRLIDTNRRIKSQECSLFVLRDQVKSQAQLLHNPDCSSFLRVLFANLRGYQILPMGEA